jgi:hypothetical protein
VGQPERLQLLVGLKDRHEHAERREHEPEPFPCSGRGHVALDEAQPPSDLRSGRLGTGPGPGQHACRSVDANDVEAGLGERDRHPPRTASELEDRAAGLFGERFEEPDVVAAREVVGVHRVVDRDVECR